MTRLVLIALLASTPAAIFAESVNPSLGFTGAPADHGGENCSTCHNTFGPRMRQSGSLQVTVGDADGMCRAWRRPSGYWSSIRRRPNGDFRSPFARRAMRRVVGHVFDSQPGHPRAGGLRRRNAVWLAGSLRRQHAPPVCRALNAPQGATAAAYEFDVNWVPPEQEVGGCMSTLPLWPPIRR